MGEEDLPCALLRDLYLFLLLLLLVLLFLTQVTKLNVCYWQEKVPGSYDIRNRFPCFVQVESLESEHHIYGLPSNEYPGLMKVSL